MLRNTWIGGSLALTAAVAFGLAESAGQSREATNAGLAAYDQIVTVLQSPRCLNCHPRGDRPHQGDDRHIHGMNVQRGADGYGMAAMRCTTCHQRHNNDMARVPGAPGWHLAPASMAWERLNKSELCRTLLDRRKNGGRSVADLIAHMTGDELVLWAWTPGAGRHPPPLTTAEFKNALETWARAGTPCPQPSRT
jgi:hypothetical protein